MDDHDKLVSALKDALTDNSPNGWALLQRVPLICNDIRIIKTNLWWIMTLGGTIGLGIMAGIGDIALHTLNK